MRKNKHLEKVFRSLKDEYDLEWMNENALFIYFNRDIPDIQLLYESTFKNSVLITVNTDSSDAPLVAEFVSKVMRLVTTKMAEPFFIDNMHKFYFGQEAYDRMSLQEKFEDERMKNGDRLH